MLMWLKHHKQHLPMVASNTSVPF